MLTDFEEVFSNLSGDAELPVDTGQAQPVSAKPYQFPYRTWKILNHQTICKSIVIAQ